MTVAAVLPPLPALSAILIASYHHFVGGPLLSPGIPDADHARWLYEQAPFCVAAHNTDTDPRFVYANRAAQDCFEYSWEEFLALRSRVSAEVPAQAERQQLLDAVTRDGFASGYRGLRVARSGRRFRIEGGVVWQLIDRHGEMRGQAATFARWRDV